MHTSEPPLWKPVTTTFSSEDELATWACQELDPYFTINHQVQGTHCTGRRLRIDAVLRPRDTSGWTDPDPAIGLEFKNPAIADGTKAYTKWAAQAVDYTPTGTTTAAY